VCLSCTERLDSTSWERNLEAPPEAPPGSPPGSYRGSHRGTDDRSGHDDITIILDIDEDKDGTFERSVSTQTISSRGGIANTTDKVSAGNDAVDFNLTLLQGVDPFDDLVVRLV